MHVQSRSWVKLSRAQKDQELTGLGIGESILQHARSLPPKERLIESAKIAFSIDPEANSDLIECIAGYSLRGGLYHHFRSLGQLRKLANVARAQSPLKPVETGPSEIDVAKLVPDAIDRYRLYIEPVAEEGRILIWQKVDGATRSVLLKRKVSRTLFLSGITLYACEGTKYSRVARMIEVVNSSAPILRLFLNFMDSLGIERSRLIARVHMHSTDNMEEAIAFWRKNLKIRNGQFARPLIEPSIKKPRRKTLMLDVRYANTMLNVLLRYWTQNLDIVVLSHGR